MAGRLLFSSNPHHQPSAIFPSFFVTVSGTAPAFSCRVISRRRFLPPEIRIVSSHALQASLKPCVSTRPSATAPGVTLWFSLVGWFPSGTPGSVPSQGRLPGADPQLQVGGGGLHLRHRHQPQAGQGVPAAGPAQAADGTPGLVVRLAGWLAEHCVPSQGFIVINFEFPSKVSFL